MSITDRRWQGALTAAFRAAGLLLSVTGVAHAQQVQTLDRQEQRDRAQREAQARQDQQQAPDVRLNAARSTDFRRTDVPVEPGCFRLSRVLLPHADLTRLPRKKAANRTRKPPAPSAALTTHHQ